MKLVPSAVRLALAVFWIGAGGLMSGEEIAGARPRLQPEWGTASLGVRTIHGLGFLAGESRTDYEFNGDFHLVRLGGGLVFNASLPDLPAGALITGLEMESCDTTATATVDAILLSRLSPTGPTDTLGSVSTGSVGTPGCAFFGNPTNLIGVGHIIDNFNRTYRVQVGLTATDESTSLGAVRIYYQMRVSPPPAAATFGDVSTSHPFFQFVEALADSGVTAGCGSGNFCPDSPLTRGQMAVFLSIALGLHFPY